MINRLLGKSLFGLLAASAFAPLAQAADAPTLNTMIDLIYSSHCH